MLAEMEVNESKPVGDCAAEGSSDGTKDAGEDGGATNRRDIAGGCIKFRAAGASVTESAVSGESIACPIRL